MKKLLLVITCITITFMAGCGNQVEEIKTIVDEPIDEPNPVEDERTLEESTQSTILEMIDEFKDSLIFLGASSSEPQAVVPTFLSNIRYLNISKDEIIESPNSTGLDAEWLDMSLIVLEYSEIIANSDYVFGENTLISDLSIDSNIWGWEITETTSVILEQNEDVLYLRVISEYTIRTFNFSYDEDHMIKILRVDENGTYYEERNVYIEDFTEGTGLSIWSMGGSYQIFTTYYLNDNDSIIISVNELGEALFTMGRYLIDDVIIMIHNEGTDKFVADYDLVNMTHYDEFDLEGNLFLEGTKVDSSLEVYAGRFYKNNVSVGYMMYARKPLSSEEDSLAITEWGFDTDISYLDILADIALAIEGYSIAGLHYDYSLGSDVILESLKDELYFDYNIGVDE